MATKDPRDRARASRLRRKVASGGASAEERAWLEEYESSRQRARPPTTTERRDGTVRPAPTHAVPDSGGGVEIDRRDLGTARVGGQGGTHPDSVAMADPPTATSEPPKARAVDFDRLAGVSRSTTVHPLIPPAPGQSETSGAQPPAKCGDPNCVACERPPKKLCPLHGTPIHPRMSERASREAAKFLFGMIDMAVRLRFGGDVELSPVPKERVETLSEGLREMSWRRAGWVSAFDDVFMVGGAIAGHVQTRAGEAKASIDAQNKRGTDGRSDPDVANGSGAATAE